MSKRRKFVFKVSLGGLLIGLLAALMISTGLFLFSSVISGRLSFANSPYPRQDRAFFVILSWVLVSAPFLILAPNKYGITTSLGMFVGLYIAFAYTTGSLMVFSATGEMFIEIAVGMKILIAPIFFIVILVVLLYNAVSGQEFFRSVIFGAVALGFLAIGSIPQLGILA